MLGLVDKQVDKITDEILLQTPKFTSIKYNSENVITGFKL